MTTESEVEVQLPSGAYVLSSEGWFHIQRGRLWRF